MKKYALTLALSLATAVLTRVGLAQVQSHQPASKGPAQRQIILLNPTEQQVRVYAANADHYIAPNKAIKLSATKLPVAIVYLRQAPNAWTLQTFQHSGIYAFQQTGDRLEIVPQLTPSSIKRLVLVNRDRAGQNVLSIRSGQQRIDIQPGKAQIVPITKLPVTTEYWTGNTQIGWQPLTITNAGIYDFQHTDAGWSMTERPRKQRPTSQRRPSTKHHQS